LIILCLLAAQALCILSLRELLEASRYWDVAVLREYGLSKRW